MKIIVADNYNALSQIGADLVIGLLKTKKNAVLGLATGTTPIGLYQKLIEAYKQGIVSFKQVKTVNLDNKKLTAFLKAYAKGDITIPEEYLKEIEKMEDKKNAK